MLPPMQHVDDERAGRDDASGPGAPELSIVVPVYAEEANLPATFARLDRALAGRAGAVEVLFVDDGSPDRSGELLAAFAAGRPWARVLTLARNHGQFTAVYAGVERARAEVVATIEAHPEHAVEDVLRLAARLTGAADVVHGVRRGRHARWWRKVGSRGLNLALRGLGVTPVRDIGFMLMVWRRPVALEAFRRPDFGHYLWALQGRRIVNVAVRCDHASQRPSAYRLPTLVACGLSALRAGVAIRRGRPRGAGGDDAPEYEVLERG